MRTSIAVAIAGVAFIAGGFAARSLPVAQAQAPAPAPLVADIIDTNLLDGAAIGPIVPNTDLRSKTLVVTERATVAVQQGNVGKHFHAQTDEIQYIVAGTGTMWLGDSQRNVKPGDLVIIPRNTHHAGTVPTSGTFKAIAIKIPPQPAGDTTFVQ